MSAPLNLTAAERQLKDDLDELSGQLNAPWVAPTLRPCLVDIRTEALSTPSAAHDHLAQWLAQGATGWIETSAAAHAVLPGQSPALQPEAELPLGAELALPGQSLRLTLSDNRWLATTTQETSDSPADAQASSVRWATRQEVMSTLQGQKWRYWVYHRLSDDGSLIACGQRLEALA